MKLSEFDFKLPKELIAKYPKIPREEARLMVLNRKDKTLIHSTFKELPKFLREGDLLIFNDTKVIPARLIGRKETGGKVEVLLYQKLNRGTYKALVGGKKIREGLKVFVGKEVEILIKEHLKESTFLVEILKGEEKLKEVGKIPIPPYLEREEEPIDRLYYQTIFAKEEGSVASPTAGLHFSEKLLKSLRERGINFAFITLHVSYATFKPLKEDDVEKNTLEEEFVKVPEETIKKVLETKRRGNKVVAVGTTVVRALESKPFKSYEGFTNLFIYPPYEFKVIDALITNFHLPRSSLLLLVCAFGGKDFILRAYQEAIKKKYRFYSYGDGMLIF